VKSIRFALALAVLLGLTASMYAAVFVVPEDRELVDKSQRIVIGVIVGSTPRMSRSGDVETVYKLRVERSLKGVARPGSEIDFFSDGGILEHRMTSVQGAAHFRVDDHVLLFLVADRGEWTLTDMTLGKFRFVTSSGGQDLLVRDAEDIVGFDKEMRTHVERVRRRDGFLTFIADTVRGRMGKSDYFLKPEEAVALTAKDKGQRDLKLNTFTPRSYSMLFTDGVSFYPGRWPDTTAGGNVIRMSAAVARPFYKNAAQNASGLGDGGVALITTALNAWNNDCGSAVNMPYSGTHANLKDGNDGINVVVRNDPGGHIAGNWTGSGVIAKAFNNGDNFHTFNAEADWVSMSDSDVVVQNGLTGAEAVVLTAMTHELGHSVSIRHSNLHSDDTACVGTDECTSTAIMNSSVNSAFGSTLQTFDINAVRAIYPASCGSAPLPPTNLTIFNTTATNISLSWSASDGATSYKVYRRTSPGAYTFIGSPSPNPASTSFIDTVATNTAYQYVVHAVNGSGESGDSNSDWTTAIAFTDTMAGGLSIKLVHVTELQTAVNALRTLAGLGAFSFTSAPSAGGTVKKSHIDDLLTALNAARTDPDINAGAISIGETLFAGTTLVKANHLTALRNGVF
jgi:hypothetical protein